MKRTSLLRAQLEDSRNPEGEKGSDVGRKRPGEEEVVHIGLAAWDRCPSASQPTPRFPLCLHLSKENVNALVHTLPHIFISVMS